MKRQNLPMAFGQKSPKTHYGFSRVFLIMSASAHFYLLEEKNIPALRKASTPTITRTWWGGKRIHYNVLGNFLQKETQYLGSFAYSGCVYGQVFMYYDDVFNYRELELGKIADELGVNLFTYRDKERIVKRISPARLKEDDLRLFAEDYYDTPEEKQECGKVLFEAIKLLHESMKQINIGQVLMLSVG